MEQLYRSSRIPKEGTYFQRLPRELNNLISLYNYECDFDVTVRISPGFLGLSFHFKGSTQMVTLSFWGGNSVELKSAPRGSWAYTTITTDPENIVQSLLQEAQKGRDIVLISKGQYGDIIFDNEGVQTPHVFTISSGDGSISIRNVSLCRQLISALLKVYPPG